MQRLKSFTYLFIILVFGAGCHTYPYKFNWSKESPAELWNVIPANFDECMARLDTMFAGKGKTHFKETNESIAVIEAYRDLGPSFISGWHLLPFPDPVGEKKKEHDQYDRFPWLSNHSDLSLFFSEAGINDPTEMVRIIFTCFHRKLNNLDYNPMPVIDQYKSYWIRSTIPSQHGQIPQGATWKVNEQMIKREDSMLNRYFLDRISLQDTMSISLYYQKHRFFSKPIFYDIEGLVENKDTIHFVVSIRISEILSSRSGIEMKKDSVWNDYKIIRKFGDIFKASVQSWEKKNDPQFYYRSNSMWQPPEP